MWPPRERFINRELSWLDFDRRVLALGEDSARPLLERVKFVSIFSRNLDEFFQVRVADLQDQAEGGDDSDSPDGRAASEQLELVRSRVIELTQRASDLVRGELRPALARAGIRVLDWPDVNEEQRGELYQRFIADILPVLVPIAVDPAHPFPYVAGLAANVAALLRNRTDAHDDETNRRFARVKVPDFLPKLWPLGEGDYVAVGEIIRGHLGELFPEDDVLATGFFRVTRDADLELRERRSGDLARDIEQGLHRRLRRSDAVRLQVSAGLDEGICSLLMSELELEPNDLYESNGLLDFGALSELYALDLPELKDEPWKPRAIASLPAPGAPPRDFFAALREQDHLVHHPYESFEGSVEGFLRAAADDPDVRVLMSTIYRTGGPESGIVRALEQAASRGKQVVVLVELKARFEEAANLERARALERAGAHVVYGLIGLKTHAKIALAVREEAGKLQRYCHVGTGNYNPVTARLYEDLGLLTASPAIGAEVSELFNRLTSGSGRRSYARLLVAPDHLRLRLLERIERESVAHDGRIILKVNSLSDPAIIDALYAASQAGVWVDLIVRGICCLRPGVKGLSERIRVRSILGRYLEHSRILRFGSERRGVETWIGSADLMPRNLDRRVEAYVPIDAPGPKARIDQILATYLRPDVRAWELGPDGAWKRTSGQLDLQRAFHKQR